MTTTADGGFDGMPEGRIDDDGTDGGLVPTAFVAVTVNVYCVLQLLVSPFIVVDVAGAGTTTVVLPG
jgi:hypothetical protein